VNRVSPVGSANPVGSAGAVGPVSAMDAAGLVRGLGEEQRFAAALAGLAGMTPVRLAKLLDGFHSQVAWGAVLAGTHPGDPKRRFAGPARTTDVSEVGERYEQSGALVLLPDMEGYPTMLIGDPGAPAVLFALGDPGVLEGRPRVAIVGTRSPTHYGRQMASELASDLAGEGVTVVSGLARGIDGAAHAGVLRLPHADAAPPVAVVGTGLDVVYPSSNRELWELVASTGAVLSESALGTKPHPGVFPARNRIIAALSDVVVVVESHQNGGSLYTADAAARRSIPVCAVPGSVKSRASDGTNALLVDGCTPVRDAADVLVAVSLARTGTDHAMKRSELGTIEFEGDDDIDGSSGVGNSSESSRTSPGAAGKGYGSVGLPASGRASRGRRAESGRSSRTFTAEQQVVWEAVDNTPTSFETILLRTNLSIAAAARICGQLVEEGALLSGPGWWSRV
jgi:DNA processing protein